MQKNIKNKFEYIGYFCVIIGLLIIIIQLAMNYSEEIELTNEINKFIDYTSTKESDEIIKSTKQDDVQLEEQNTPFMILEIPKIKLKRTIYEIDSKLNNVEQNIQLLKESTMPDIDKSNVILAAHNGNSKVSFFNKLYKLTVDDEIYIYYKGNKYIYKLAKIYEIDKDGIAEIYRDKNQNSISLITCKKNNKTKQEVYIGYLIDSYYY